MKGKWPVVSGALLVTGVVSAFVLAIAPAGRSASAVSAVGAPFALTSGTPDIKSAGVLAFGPDNVLFIGDSDAGAVFAVQVPDAGPAAGTPRFRVDAFDTKLAQALGTTPDTLRIRDLAVHPRSRDSYVTVAVTRPSGEESVLVKVTPAGAVERVALAQVPFSKAEIANAPTAADKDRGGDPLRPLTITDMSYSDGQLFVAGLSGEGFGSTFRRLPFPFASRAGAGMTGVEIYHTSHSRYETQSPITAFLPLQLGGAPHLLAGYTCAPLATFPMAELTSRPKVRGKTIAELGGGNRPLDMIELTYNGKRHVYIANSHRTLMRMAVDDIERAAPMTTAVPDAYVAAGAPYVAIAMVGVLQLDKLDAGHFVSLRRDTASGRLTLESHPASMFWQ